MNTHPMDIHTAGIADDTAIAPLMEAFNRSEGIAWQPAVMRAALRQILSGDDLGMVLVARDRSSGETTGYCLATYGYDL